MVSDEYKRGWYDGYQAAQKDSNKVRVVGPAYTLPPVGTTNTRCSTCGIDIGNKTWGYVCYHPKCPSKVTC